MKITKMVIVSIVIFLSVTYLEGALRLTGGFLKSSYKLEDIKKDSGNSFIFGIGYEDYNSSKVLVGVDCFYTVKPLKIDLKGKYYQTKNLYGDFFLKIKILRGTTPYLMAGGFGALIFPKRSDANWTPIKNYKNPLKYDYGILLGGGIHFELFNMAFSLEGRYRKGFAKIKLNNYTEINNHSFGVLLTAILGSSYSKSCVIIAE